MYPPPHMTCIYPPPHTTQVPVTVVKEVIKEVPVEVVREKVMCSECVQWVVFLMCDEFLLFLIPRRLFVKGQCVPNVFLMCS
jgi:hypothetical protein